MDDIRSLRALHSVSMQGPSITRVTSDQLGEEAELLKKLSRLTTLSQREAERWEKIRNELIRRIKSTGRKRDRYKLI